MKSLVMLSLLALAAPAAAQITFESAPPPPAANAKNGKGQDKIVCESQEQLGSRLGGQKVCKTVAQWAEERRQERLEVERTQATVNQAPSH